MAIGSPQWMYKSGEAYEIEQSLKFNNPDNPYLSRTFVTPTNRKIFTFSGWVKRSFNPDYPRIISTATGNDNINFMNDDTLRFQSDFGYLVTTMKFRDPGAWYHIMYAFDSTQSTAANRLKLYVNGTQVTAFGTSDYPTLNDEVDFNSAIVHDIGRNAPEALEYMDGYLAELYWVDGQALTPSSFGETGDYGEWKPIEYSGTYGNNGFYLPFKQDYTVEGFSTVTYKGTGASQYVGGVGFKPDLVWNKRRDSGAWHLLSDTLRNNGKNPLYPNDTAVESNDPSSVNLGVRNNDGFTIGTGGAINTSGASMVAWNWDMGADTPTGFSAVTYKGNGTAGQTIGGVGFQPDLVWIKNKTDADSHFLYDAVRGAKNYLQSDTTGAQATTNQMTAFNPDGFTVDEDGGSATNDDGDNFVAWCWDMGGTSVANTTGSINSTVRANPTYGQSIVSYTGNATSGATIGHGLSSTPEMIIVKNTQSTSNWAVLHKGIAADYETDYIAMNNSSTAVDNVAYWNDTEPTNQVFSVGNDNDTNQNNNPLIAYCFHSVTGYSKFGSYTGSGSSGKVVTTGFRPAFVMVKRTTGEPWAIADSTRNPLNPTRWELYASNNDADYETGGVGVVNMTDTGFTIQATAGQWNASGGSYIYMAFAGGMDSISDYNTDGSSDSRVKASTTYGQSIVSYTGQSGAQTIGHGLSSAPEVVLVKNRSDADEWLMYHHSLTDAKDKYLRLDSAGAVADNTFWNDTAPTSSVFSVGDNRPTNSGHGSSYIAYCWHSVSGYSSIGSFTGTGSATAITINCGFKPAFILMKVADASSNRDWYIWDDTRSNPIAKHLRPNIDNAEAGEAGKIEFTSTGVSITTNDDELNANGKKTIYMVFADKREYAYWLDQSGQNNDWTSNNLTESDISVDSPTNNFATIDPLSSGAGVFSEGNLKYTSTADTGVATLGISSGKAYAEVTISSASNTYIGVCDISRGINPLRGGNWSDHGGIAYKQNGDQYKLAVGSNTSATVSYGDSYTNGDIIGIAIDVDNDTITFYKNGVSQGNTASGPSFLSSGGVYSIMIYGGADMIFTVNFGQDSSFAGNKTAQGNQDGNDIGDFYYTPPTGFLALCTKNLPDVAVTPSEHFNTILYTGDNATGKSITGVGFSPSFIWFKERNNTAHHVLHDAVRGASGGRLSSNRTNAEDASTSIASFDSDGFTVGSSAAYINSNNANIVAWNWKANGSGSSNTNGSINSTVSANVDAGFSIVSYTGTGSNATVGHGLSKAPEMIIVKRRSAVDGWGVYHSGVGATKVTNLDEGGASYTYSTGWNNTAPTSSVFSVGTWGGSNASSSTYIAYAFCSVDGYSKVGSYTGNGNADGTFVYTGFRPAWVMIKNADTSGRHWGIQDIKRSIYNPAINQIDADSSGAAFDSAGRSIDYLSNGFKCRTADSDKNTSGETYIYIAFAETPFKNSNAR